MKLAEALQERADLTRKIGEIRSRMNANALVQEGEEAAEDPNELLKELNSAIVRLTELICLINKTNCETIKDGKSLSDLIAEKDCLKLQAAAYRDLISKASERVDRYTSREIRIVSNVDVKALQKKADAIAKKVRLLDNTLQECNWVTEIKD